MSLLTYLGLESFSPSYGEISDPTNPSYKATIIYSTSPSALSRPIFVEGVRILIDQMVTTGLPKEHTFIVRPEFRHLLTDLEELSGVTVVVEP